MNILILTNLIHYIQCNHVLIAMRIGLPGNLRQPLPQPFCRPMPSTHGLDLTCGTVSQGVRRPRSRYQFPDCKRPSSSHPSRYHARRWTATPAYPLRRPNWGRGHHHFAATEWYFDFLRKPVIQPWPPALFSILSQEMPGPLSGWLLPTRVPVYNLQKYPGNIPGWPE